MGTGIGPGTPRHPTLKIDDKISLQHFSNPPLIIPSLDKFLSNSPSSYSYHFNSPLIPKMAPSATDSETVDQTVLSLRKVLVSESEPLARRFRALFSLKHLACLQPPNEQTLPAIQAIAAGFASRSALLKHELAYCLGQTLNRDSVSYLQHVVKDVEEDAMCRHEAAEALGALGYDDSLDLLKKLRDDESELEIIRETCDIAVDRIVWENSEERKAEKLKPRYDLHDEKGPWGLPLGVLIFKI